MRAIQSFPAALVTLLALAAWAATSIAAEPDDLRGMAAVTGNPAAGKTHARVCSACHGANGQAIVPQFPDLAGQSTTYLYVQMQAFKGGQRDNAVMQGQLAPLSDTDLRDLAAYFASMPVSAGADATTGDTRGATLFHDGDATRGIPACQGCHGADGRGPHADATSHLHGVAWATFPALAGQNAEYVAAQLKAYQDGSRHGTTNTQVMAGVTAHLDAADIDALAGYIAGM